MSAATTFHKGCWVASSEETWQPRFGRVHYIYDDGHLDIVMYARDGSRLGRTSPALGGPKGFEPYCSPELWKPIKQPDFGLISERTHAWDDLVVDLVPAPEKA